jgi:hypothetical protein
MGVEAQRGRVAHTTSIVLQGGKSSPWQINPPPRQPTASPQQVAEQGFEHHIKSQGKLVGCEISDAKSDVTSQPATVEALLS